MKKYIKPNARIVANIIYEQSLMAGSLNTSGLPDDDAPGDGGVNENEFIQVDSKKHTGSSAWDGWTEYTSWDD